MVPGDELCGILAGAMEKERAARLLYLEAAGKVCHPLGKKMFERLAEEEGKHERLLASWSAQEKCPVDTGFGRLDLDFVSKGRARVRAAVKPTASDLEAISLAQEMERKAIAFYRDCAAKASGAASKDLFLRLRAEEDRHLAVLTDLYDFLVNPAVWSVRDQKSHFDA